MWIMLNDMEPNEAYTEAIEMIKSLPKQLNDLTSTNSTTKPSVTSMVEESYQTPSPFQCMSLRMTSPGLHLKIWKFGSRTPSCWLSYHKLVAISPLLYISIY